MEILDLGLSSYSKALEAQKQNRNSETIICFKSHPIFTIGRKGSSQFLPKNMETLEVDRGGSVTYHGPNQLILFPCFNLEEKFKSPRPVKEVTNYLVNFGLYLCENLNIKNAYSREDNPGIYVGKKKIGALGFRITKDGISHGFAINVFRDPNYLLINPCDLKEFQAGALEEFTSNPLSYELIIKLTKEFVKGSYGKAQEVSCAESAR